jgi:hypothetical protein
MKYVAALILVALSLPVNSFAQLVEVTLTAKDTRADYAGKTGVFAAKSGVLVLETGAETDAQQLLTHFQRGVIKAANSMVALKPAEALLLPVVNQDGVKIFTVQIPYTINGFGGLTTAVTEFKGTGSLVVHRQAVPLSADKYSIVQAALKGGVEQTLEAGRVALSIEAIAINTETPAGTFLAASDRSAVVFLLEPDGKLDAATLAGHLKSERIRFSMLNTKVTDVQTGMYVTDNVSRPYVLVHLHTPYIMGMTTKPLGLSTDEAIVTFTMAPGAQLENKKATWLSVKAL